MIDPVDYQSVPVTRAPAIRVVNVAMGQVGAHYLTGGYGAMPGKGGGSDAREYDVALLECLEPQKPGESLAIHAATNGLLGRNVCAGGTPRLMGTRSTTSGAPDLVAYLAGLKGKKPEEWGNFFNSYTPRQVYVKGKLGRLHWGEDCRDSRHFDCIGFVNYCFEKAGVINCCQKDIPQWIAATTEVKDPQLGDLLILWNGPGQHQHIGIVANNNKIVQAADTYAGVHANSDVRMPGVAPKSPNGITFTHLRRFKEWV